jgi:periplasmic divalent cation tolerance protein
VAKGKLIVVFMTAKDRAEARSIARALVEERLVSCVNIVPKIESMYTWKGQVCDEAESMMVAKTRAALLPRIVRRVRKLHSYEVPEIISVKIEGGSADYLKWVMDNTRKGK